MKIKLFMGCAAIACFAAASFAPFAMGVTTSSGASSTEPQDLTPQAAQALGYLPLDPSIKEVHSRGGVVSVEVPAAKNSQIIGTGEMPRDRGESEDVAAARDTEGNAYYMYGSPSSAGDVPVTTARKGRQSRTLGGCSDGLYVLAGDRWFGGFSFYSSSTNRPAAISQVDLNAANVYGFLGVANSRNNCGYGDPIPYAFSHLGTTATVPQISTAGACLATDDGVNVTGFGSFGGPGTTLAANCRWVSGANTTVGSDIKFNYSWVWTATTTCSGSTYSMRGVGTHEWGHGFGLKHPQEGVDHNQLTMTWRSPPCWEDQTYLGAGDELGLDAKY